MHNDLAKAISIAKYCRVSYEYYTRVQKRYPLNYNRELGILIVNFNKPFNTQRANARYIIFLFHALYNIYSRGLRLLGMIQTFQVKCQNT